MAPQWRASGLSWRPVAFAAALDGAQAPWNLVKPFYDLLNGRLYKPIGIPLDYNRIQQTRPKIAELLR